MIIVIKARAFVQLFHSCEKDFLFRYTMIIIMKLGSEEIELIPKLIKPYFKITHEIKDRDNSVVEGILTCCNANDFEIYVVGKIKHGLFSKMFLYPEENDTVLEVRCKKCGKIISVFNSSFDGYGKCGTKEKNTHVSIRTVDCLKCQNESFSVIAKYEYPDIQELKELEISNMDNAFTWIWITLECNKCGTKYKNFVNCETT